VRIKANTRGASDMSKIDKQILQLLRESGPLTLAEIADRLDEKPKAVFRSLRRLFEKGEVISDPRTRCYSLAEKE